MKRETSGDKNRCFKTYYQREQHFANNTGKKYDRVRGMPYELVAGMGKSSLIRLHFLH